MIAIKKVIYGFCWIDVHKQILRIYIITEDLERCQTWKCDNNGNAIRVLVKQL
ncbi:MAG: hypothetical protein ACFFD4_23920 [Candidatus Odinarchaeota archaeon]